MRGYRERGDRLKTLQATPRIPPPRLNPKFLFVSLAASFLLWYFPFSHIFLFFSCFLVLSFERIPSPPLKLEYSAVAHASIFIPIGENWSPSHKKFGLSKPLWVFISSKQRPCRLTASDRFQTKLPVTQPLDGFVAVFPAAPAMIPFVEANASNQERKRKGWRQWRWAYRSAARTMNRKRTMG